MGLAETPPAETRPAEQALDVLIVSLGSTAGLRTADAELHDSLARAGARVAIARALPPAPARTLMLTDLAWARAARAAATRALAQQRRPPRAIVYSSTTAALLWPRAGAIRFDAPSAGNRPGRHGLWQRPLERRRLGRAPLLLPWSEGGLAEVPAAARSGDRAIVLPVPVEPSGPSRPIGERDIAAITYAANPAKKGLDRVLAAWRGVREECKSREAGDSGGERAADCEDELVVAGASLQELELAGYGVGAEQGVRVLGALPAAEYRALVRRARVFVCAPRREDYGIAQLEALAEGCLLVTTPAPGPYAALPIARALDPRLVDNDLRSALRAALLDPPADYAARALAALSSFKREAVDRAIADDLLRRLVPDYRVH
jgi:glycosyltransferase involved in cell wall biosynthesis